MTFAEGNVLDVPPGIAQAVAAGYQLMVEALPVGAHEIHVYAELEGGEVHADVTCRVIVEEPTVIEPAATPGATPPA